jgi:transcriptional regulator with XRE-family HTH domain
LESFSDLFQNNLLSNSLHFGFLVSEEWLDVRRSAGESSTAIGRELGVSRQAAQRWMKGATQPSRTALILAEQLYRAPPEMAPGLPRRPGERDSGH